MNRILIVGTIRNPDRRFENNLKKLIQSIPTHFEVSIFIIESDSEPSKLSILNDIKRKNTNFDFVSLGRMSGAVSDRIERIRISRDKYVEYIRSNFAKIGWRYIIVADLDGMNAKITLQGIESSLKLLSKFDGVFANQKHGYYDLYALRSKGWIDVDPVLELYSRLSLLESQRNSRFFAKTVHKVHQFKERTNVIYDRMKLIDKNRPPITVISAFGALGIYKTEVFLNLDYSRLDEHVRQSEHVDLHLKGVRYGYKFAINPAMINSNWNTHNINRLVYVRMIRSARPLKFIRVKFFN